VQRVREIAVRLGIRRQQPDRRAESGFRLGGAAEAAQHDAEIVVRFRQRGVRLDRPPDIADGVVGAAALMRDLAQQVERLGLLRVGCQRLEIRRLGRVQASGAVIGEAAPDQAGGIGTWSLFGHPAR
jgi:hypothetical protein